MTAQLYGGPIAVQAGGARNLQDAIPNQPTRQVYGVLTIRADTGNVGTLWFGLSTDLTATANQIGFIKADEAITIAITGALPLSGIFFIGTVGDKAYAMGVAY